MDTSEDFEKLNLKNFGEIIAWFKESNSEVQKHHILYPESRLELFILPPPPSPEISFIYSYRGCMRRKIILDFSINYRYNHKSTYKKDTFVNVSLIEFIKLFLKISFNNRIKFKNSIYNLFKDIRFQLHSKSKFFKSILEESIKTRSTSIRNDFKFFLNIQKSQNHHDKIF